MAAGYKNVQTLDDAIKNLLQNYEDFNPNEIVELHEEPSAVEFSRYVQRNRPFVLRGGARSWHAFHKWDAAYLNERLKDKQVDVAFTPRGNADSPLHLAEGTIGFVKPHYESRMFPELLKYLQNQENEEVPASPVLYGQTQNDNLRDEYRSLLDDIQETIPWASIALNTGNGPHEDDRLDAVNFWIGNSHSTTALHRDPYENIYVQIRGEKHFTLLPAIAAPCVNEQLLKPMTYVPMEEAEEKQRIDIPFAFKAVSDENGDEILFPTWDPELPVENPTQYSHLCKPFRVTLKPGDMLYLPSFWYHRVAQSVGEEKFCCAVNFWYDMDFNGVFAGQCYFVQEISKVANGVQRILHGTNGTNDSD